MAVYGYTDMQREMVLTVARTPGRWFVFGRRFRSTARSLRRRGIVEYRATADGIQARIRRGDV